MAKRSLRVVMSQQHSVRLSSGTSKAEMSVKSYQRLCWFLFWQYMTVCKRTVCDTAIAEAQMMQPSAQNAGLV